MTGILKRRPCEDGDRNWRGVSRNQETPRITCKLRKRHGQFFPQGFQKAPSSQTSWIKSCSIQNCERINFSCLKQSSWWYIIMVAFRKFYIFSKKYAIFYVQLNFIVMPKFLLLPTLLKATNTYWTFPDFLTLCINNPYNNCRIIIPTLQIRIF